MPWNLWLHLPCLSEPAGREQLPEWNEPHVQSSCWSLHSCSLMPTLIVRFVSSMSPCSDALKLNLCEWNPSWRYPQDQAQPGIGFWCQCLAPISLLSHRLQARSLCYSFLGGQRVSDIFAGKKVTEFPTVCTPKLLGLFSEEMQPSYNPFLEFVHLLGCM